MRGLGRALLALVGAAALLVGSGCGGQVAPSAPQLRVVDPWARPASSTPGPASSPGGHMGPGMAPGGMATATSAVYMRIVNDGDASDVLLGAESPVASRVELHESVREGDMVRMRPVARIEIPARGAVELRPGGLHVMLMGLQRDLMAGTKVPLTLRFERSGAVAVEAVVRSAGP